MRVTSLHDMHFFHQIVIALLQILSMLQIENHRLRISLIAEPAFMHKGRPRDLLTLQLTDVDTRSGPLWGSMPPIESWDIGAASGSWHY